VPTTRMPVGLWIKVTVDEVTLLLREVRAILPPRPDPLEEPTKPSRTSFSSKVHGGDFLPITRQYRLIRDEG
jgi:hypothetical protein